MNDLPRQKLVEMVARYGHSLAQENRRCEGLLRDYCSAYRREVAVLVSAMEERIAADLLAADHGLPRQSVLAKLAKRLHDNRAIEERAARWAVNTWALALGFLPQSELEAMENADHQAVPFSRSPVINATNPPAPQPLLSDIVLSAKGDGDYKYFRDAMRNLPEGGRLLVRPGLYHEGIVIDKPVEIIGDGKRKEIIVVSAGASCIKMQTDKATVRGLTLRQEADGGEEGFFAVDIPQGRLTLEDCDITSGSLSCVGVHNEKSDTLIRSCRIHNSADSGIYFFHRAAGTVEECDIYDNRNVGVAITEGAVPTVKRCSIRDGRNAGIVVWNQAGGLIEECDIFSNAKTNVGISEGGNPTLRHCRIYSGENSGVFVHDAGQGTLEDCDIYRHTAVEIAVTRRGNLTMNRCKIHDGVDSGIFITEAGRLLLQECEVFDNADAGVHVEGSGVAAIQHCRITRNGSVAIRVEKGGAVRVEECDLSENQMAPWQTQQGAHIEGQGNRW